MVCVIAQDFLWVILFYLNDFKAITLLSQELHHRLINDMKVGVCKVCMAISGNQFWKFMTQFFLPGLIRYFLDLMKPQKTEPSRQFLVKSQRWKHQNDGWNLLKVVNEHTRTRSIMPLWCLYYYFRIDFPHCSRNSLFDFK